MNKTKENSLSRRRIATRVKTGEMFMRSPYRRGIDAWVISGMVFLLAGLGRADTYNWNGSAGSDWFAAANWTPPGPPPAGADVVYSNTGTSLLLTNETPLLSTFTQQSGTLTCTNWFTRIRAGTVALQGGTITLPPAFADGAMSNRVWIVATGDFSLGASAVIDVSGKGFKAANGPGKGVTEGRSGGGGYGGKGGMGWEGRLGGNPYGQLDSPLAPGSGGGNVTTGGAGGGVVRIDAGGSVILDGVVSANGSGSINNGRAGGGSGGAIFISCDSFSGASTGLLSVNGGACYASGTSAGNEGGNGGGGRIAVVYAALGTPRAVRFSSAAGLWGFGNAYPDHFWHHAGVDGTVLLSDTAILSASLTNGQFVGTRLFFGSGTSWSPGALTVENCSLTFAQPGFRVAVGGDVWVKNGTLGMGDPLGTGYSELVCAGNLTLTNSGKLAIFSGVTNGLVDFGSLVSVTGALSVASGCWIYPSSHPSNGGSARFRLGDLLLATNGGFNANARGFGMGYGPGKGLTDGGRGSGGGYGGKGGSSLNNARAGGSGFGSAQAPLDSGSGGGGGTYTYYGGPGGGLVHAEVNRDILLNGGIYANGGNPPYAMANGARSGGGAGGGIFLACAGQFTVGSQSVLRADGGRTMTVAGAAEGGAGGGGRIAVWHQVSAEQRLQLLAGADLKQTVTNSFAGIGTLSATNGLGWAEATAQANTDYYARPGTVVFLTVPPPQGTLMLIR